ncbi:MAG: inositol monophosphatase family protein [Planctomycetota bacterium]
MSLLEPATLERALSTAEAAAREAGALLLEHLGRLDPAALRTKSSARDLQSAADIASERCIVKRLRAAFPDFAIEAEEEVHDARLDGRPRWFLDPLDGTVNFVSRLPAFSVSIALYETDAHGSLVPSVAIVFVPRLAEMFTAVRGGGAFENGLPMRVSQTEQLGDAILATGFPYRRNELRNNNLENWNRFFLDVRGLRRMGSAAMDLAYVASGRFDGFWELHLAPHDVAAGALLVREAGGRVTDVDGGGDWLRGGHIVAAGPHLFERVRAGVQR